MQWNAPAPVLAPALECHDLYCGIWIILLNSRQSLASSVGMSQIDDIDTCNL